MWTTIFQMVEVGLNDLGDLFQPKRFSVSVILWSWGFNVRAGLKVSLLWGGGSCAFFYCQPNFVVECVGRGENIQGTWQMVHVLAETPICTWMASSALYLWENCNMWCTLALTASILLKDMKKSEGCTVIPLWMWALVLPGCIPRATATDSSDLGPVSRSLVLLWRVSV